MNWGWAFLILNVFTFLICGWDKFQSRRAGIRVPERILIGLAFCGGAVGLYMGMFTFRHKTKKPLFLILVPLLIVIQMAVANKLLFRI